MRILGMPAISRPFRIKIRILRKGDSLPRNIPSENQYQLYSIMIAADYILIEYSSISGKRHLLDYKWNVIPSSVHNHAYKVPEHWYPYFPESMHPGIVKMEELPVHLAAGYSLEEYRQIPILIADIKVKRI